MNCAWTPQCHVNCERQQGNHSKRRLRTHKTKFALSNGMERLLAKNTNNRDHENHVVEKGHNSTRHCNIVNKPILLLQTILDAKAAVDKEWENRGYCQHGKNQKSSKELSSRHRKSQKQFIVQRPWNCATSKTIDWTRSSKHMKGRVVQCGDVVKDDSGSCAVFTEQGSSASHRTAAQVLCVISRLPRTRRTSK